MTLPHPSDTLKDRYLRLIDRIQKAAIVSGRSERDVVLVGVTKNVSVEKINSALLLGLKHVGENRVQEAAAKRPELKTDFDVQMHLIGALQTNKAKKAMELFDVIQSVDRPKLAQFLERCAVESGKTQRCLIEVKISDEETKSGVPLSEASGFIQSFEQYKNLKLEGLMTIAPLHKDHKEMRLLFRDLRKFFDEHKRYFGATPQLSMGMTDDFEMAIEEGSTMVRIGRGLFGERA